VAPRRTSIDSDRDVTLQNDLKNKTVI